jgi:hypothetical protein
VSSYSLLVALSQSRCFCDTPNPSELIADHFDQLGAFAFTGLIITAINYFKPSDGSAPNSGSDVAEISPWLVQIMSIISAGLPFWLPGILLAITLRFDYSRDRSVALPNTHKTTDPVDVPAKVPAFRPTLFNAGLAATALSQPEPSRRVSLRANPRARHRRQCSSSGCSSAWCACPARSPSERGAKASSATGGTTKRREWAVCRVGVAS